MADFEYANARLRAMRSNLLDHHQMAQLSQSADLETFTRRLANTPYQHALEAAFFHASELDMVLEAIRHDFHATVKKISGFYSERTVLSLVLRPFDVHNLKSLLRGLTQHASPETIRGTFFPAGELNEFILSELLPSGSPRAAIDRLATLGHPFAAPLVALRASRPGADSFEMDLTLDQWRHTTTRRTLRDSRGTEWSGTITRWIDIEADIANLMVALRFVHNPGEQAALAARYAGAGFTRLLVEPGRLPVDRLAALSGEKTVPAAVTALEGTPYQQVLASAGQVYQKTHFLSSVESALRTYQARWQAEQIGRDPLGAGVLLGYLAQKEAECARLRRIAASLWRGTPPEQIRAGLEERL